MITDQPITILGAGIGGLAAAAALAQCGATVTVLEQAPEITEVGAGLQVSPNGVRVLDALGLGDKARADATQSRGVWLRDGVSGHGVLDLDFRMLKSDDTFLLYHRADLQRLLFDAALQTGATIRCGQRIEAVQPGQDGTTVTLQGKAPENMGFVIGADGLHSVMRPALNGPATPKFTGQVAWRALVPATGREQAEATIFMGPGRHMVTYPLRGGSVVNIVAVEERTDWADEGWFHKDDPANLLSAFSGFCDDALALLERVEIAHLWGLFLHPVAANWHQGQAVLLGDAAHPTLPFMAQGAVMALEDAWVLADCLGRHGIERGPTAYQALRKPRTERIVAEAHKNARNYHYSNPLLRKAGHASLRLAGRFAPQLLMQRYDWIYDEDVTRRT
ncbi:FAD-dependent monooxygenase [Aliiroseovarius sp. F20344]|uniref:FAD-dependent monooxygenase n=1 Tax=Aliiroseovarius sp. F20344 TaxID=2926414 RepID=UPI001FF317C0|nr:FAD-dependent monooxygenase [Aliiroseovarius sp. F20344]MCK0143547.1 FAD-dependent monooxygenase [Aliiroseovarius sp. F20344]